MISDDVLETIAIIKAVFDGLGSLSNLVLAIPAVILALMQYQTNRRVMAVAAAVAQVSENVAKVEIQTNSMKDLLVEKTAAASHAEGMVAGAAQQSELDTARSVAIDAARAEGAAKT